TQEVDRPDRSNREREQEVQGREHDADKTDERQQPKVAENVVEEVRADDRVHVVDDVREKHHARKNEYELVAQESLESGLYGDALGACFLLGVRELLDGEEAHKA